MSDKITKLSDAIRLGATFKPQCTGTFFDNGRSCALGAALDAMATDDPNELVRRFPHLEQHRNSFGWTLYSIIVELNDQEHWTRERIASWLESIGY